MNWNELKEFCNSLPKEELEKKVILWRECDAIGDICARTLDEDHYSGDNDEGCYPLSDAGLTLDDVEEKGLEKNYDKGTPILQENF